MDETVKYPEPVSRTQIEVERGLLDLTVRLSTKEITAGKQFAVFVLVKNPFAQPVWIERVHVSLPSELILSDERIRKVELLKQEQEEDKRDHQAREADKALQQSIDRLQRTLNTITSNARGADSQISVDLEDQIRNLAVELKKASTSGPEIRFHLPVHVEHIKIESTSPKIRFHGNIDEGNGDDYKSIIEHLEIVDPRTVIQKMRKMAHERQVTLQSSLPEGVALQPSSTAVYTVLLNVKRSYVFPPSNYLLQFSVNFSFKPLQFDENGQRILMGSLLTNTVAHEITIRPSVYSLIGGAAIGGLSGAVARLLKVTGQFSLDTLSWSVGISNAFTIILSVILSIVAIIFVARKSEAQSFISVEDFWGGLLIGFFVGYTGTEFFAELTRIKGASPTVPGGAG